MTVHYINWASKCVIVVDLSRDPIYAQKIIKGVSPLMSMWRLLSQQPEYQRKRTKTFLSCNQASVNEHAAARSKKSALIDLSLILRLHSDVCSYAT